MTFPASETIPSPDISIETLPVWEGARQGKLIVGRCVSCMRHHHYPRSKCPLCHSEKVEFVASAGRGSIYSFSVLRRTQVPYALAWVTLDEGPGLMTNIVNADLDGLEIGQRVQVVFVSSQDGTPVPMFEPA